MAWPDSNAPPLSTRAEEQASNLTNKQYREHCAEDSECAVKVSSCRTSAACLGGICLYAASADVAAGTSHGTSKLQLVL